MADSARVGSETLPSRSRVVEDYRPAVIKEDDVPAGDPPEQIVGYGRLWATSYISESQPVRELIGRDRR